MFVSAAPFLQFTFAYPAVRHLVVALIPKRVKLARASHNAFVNNKVRARLSEEGDHIKSGTNVKRDFISYLLRHKPDQDALTDQEIIINTSMLVIAGSETTATAMAGVTFWLLRTPAALKKATEEVRRLFQKDIDIDFSSATSMRVPYVAACIEEALRMYPPTPAGLPRVVENDIVVAGNSVPKNVSDSYITSSIGSLKEPLLEANLNTAHRRSCRYTNTQRIDLSKTFILLTNSTRNDGSLFPLRPRRTKRGTTTLSSQGTKNRPSNLSSSALAIALAKPWHTQNYA